MLSADLGQDDSKSNSSCVYFRSRSHVSSRTNTYFASIHEKRNKNNVASFFSKIVLSKCAAFDRSRGKLGTYT